MLKGVEYQYLWGVAIFEEQMNTGKMIHLEDKHFHSKEELDEFIRKYDLERLKKASDDSHL